MGVYIKSMKKQPQNCEECDVKTVCKNYWELIREQHTRPSWCPLVPLPTPHGRLIDADEMKESIRKQTAFLRLIGGEFAEIAETLEKGFLQEVDNAPTIIPAEGGDVQ